MIENKIVVMSDIDDVIAFDDVSIKHDTINRAEVEEVEKAIKSLEQDKIMINDRIVELKAKLIYARKIIAIADEKRNSEISSNNANVTNESRVGSSFSNMQTQRREV